MARRIARRALPIVAGAFVVGGLVQVFLAGLGVFSDPSSFITHREMGYALGWFTLVMLVLALVGREPRPVVGLTILVLAQFVLQSVFVALRESVPTVAALHPVNGFLILVAGSLIARWSWVARDEPVATSATIAGGAAAEAR